MKEPEDGVVGVYDLGDDEEFHGAAVANILHRGIMFTRKIILIAKQLLHRHDRKSLIKYQ
jgi:hypothetical protein